MLPPSYTAECVWKDGFCAVGLCGVTTNVLFAVMMPNEKSPDPEAGKHGQSLPLPEPVPFLRLV